MESYSNISSRIEIVTEGLHEWTKKQYNLQEKEEIIQKYNLPENYILTVGTLEPRKNLVSVILGFKEFLKTYPDFKLVIVGKKGWFYEEIFKTVEKNNLLNSVCFLGYVPDVDLPVVYDLSRFVVSLSNYEGFGLPVIEANARGKVVLMSNIAAYNELNVCGNRINLHLTHTEIGKSMVSTLETKFVLPDNFFDTYSWKKAASQLLNLWR